MFERDVQPARSTPTSAARIERRGVPQDVAPVAALRDRLPAAGRDGEGARAGRSSPPTCRGGIASERRQRRDSRRSTALTADRAGTGCRAICSARSDAYFDRFAETMGDASRQRNAAATEDAPSGRRPSATTCRSASRTRRWPSRSPPAFATQRGRPARRPLHRRVPQRLRRRARPSACAPPARPPRRRRLGAAGRGPRRARARRRGSEAGRLSRLHD